MKTINEGGDMLLVIDNLIHDHEALRGHIQLLKQSAGKWRAMLDSHGLNESSNNLQMITEKRRTFIQALGYLKDGLEDLHRHEEEVISVLGIRVLRPIQSAHIQITRKIAEIESLIINLRPDQVSFHVEELATAIDALCAAIREHSLVEDGLLSSWRIRLTQEGERILQPA
jgi:hypothetical protein